MKKLKSIFTGVVIGGILFGGAVYFIERYSNDRILISNEEGASKDIIKNKTGKTITDMEAKQIIFKKVPNGDLVEFGYENDKTPSYDGKIIKDNVVYEFSIDAQTGQIVEYEEDFEPQYKNNKDIKFIDEEKAKDIMMKKVGGGKFIEFKFDKDDRIPKYEGTILKDNMEYDISINAETGKILGFDKEHYD